MGTARRWPDFGGPRDGPQGPVRATPCDFLTQDVLLSRPPCDPHLRSPHCDPHTQDVPLIRPPSLTTRHSQRPPHISLAIHCDPLTEDVPFSATPTLKTGQSRPGESQHLLRSRHSKLSAGHLLPPSHSTHGNCLTEA